MPENTIPTNTYKYLKVFILGLLGLVCFAVAFALTSTAIYQHRELAFWVWPAMAMISGIVFFSLFSLVNENRLYMAIFAVLAAAAYFFFLPKNIYAIIGGLVFLIMVFWFEQRMQLEEKSRQSFAISRIVSATASIIIYAFFLVLGLNIYANTSDQFKQDPDRFYDKMGQSMVRSARYISGEDRSGIDFNQSLDQYLATQAAEENPNYASLPPEQQQAISRAAREQFFRQFSIEVAGEKSLAEVMAQIAVDQIKQTSERFQPFFPLIFTLIILGLLRTFTFLFRWIVVGATWIVFRILLAFKFFHIKKVQVEADLLEV